MWAARPYSFSAATDLSLARLAVALALQHRQGRRGSAHEALAGTPETLDAPDPGDGSARAAAQVAVLDPCCGSGSVLFAAALQGARSIGCDLNPLAVRGSLANLAHASSSLGWAPGTATVIEHDCTAALPEAACATDVVVASLPWDATLCTKCMHPPPSIYRCAGRRRCLAAVGPLATDTARPLREGAAREPPIEPAACHHLLLPLRGADRPGVLADDPWRLPTTP